MRIYVQELKASALSQTIAVTSDILVKTVRLHLYKHNSPSGTFTMQITDNSDNVITSKGLTVSEMQSSGSAALSQNLYRGYISFELSQPVALRAGTFKIKLTSSGYTFAESAYIGWLKDWDDTKPSITDASTPKPADSPFDFEIYSLKGVK